MTEHRFGPNQLEATAPGQNTELNRLGVERELLSHLRRSCQADQASSGDRKKNPDAALPRPRDRYERNFHGGRDPDPSRQREDQPGYYQRKNNDAPRPLQRQGAGESRK